MLWSGSVHRLDSGPNSGQTAAGELRLIWRRKFTLEWHLADEATVASWRGTDWDIDDPRFGFEFAGVVTPLPVHYANRFSGWTNGGALGRPQAEMAEVIGQLINMPTIHGSRMVQDAAAGKEWTGRWQATAANWTITIDSTPDQIADFERAKREETFAVTHTVRIARADGSTFQSAKAEDVTFALQLALSFAVGYWVGLAGSIGFDAAGDPVWRLVRAPHTGIAQRGGGWWVDSRPTDLADYVVKFLGEWNDDPGPMDPLRFAATSSVLANATGFVEQRVMASISALETLSWTAEVLEGTWPEAEWRRDGARRLRRLLTGMQVDARFSHGPGKSAISKYGQAEQYHDLAETVIRVRNSITHPKPCQNVYAHEGVLVEAWRHAAYWLELAILHRLGFNGRVADRTIPRQWVGESASVPWSTVADDPENS